MSRKKLSEKQFYKLLEREEHHDCKKRKRELNKRYRRNAIGDDEACYCAKGSYRKTTHQFASLS